MLKIEIMKFQAQDIITTSAAGPKCICGPGCDVVNGQHTFFSEDYPNGIACLAQKHDCPNP